MEELKMLIEMVSKLPNTALWVLTGYLIYKLAVVGSWFGLARFLIDRMYKWLTKPKYELIEMKVSMRSTILNGDVYEAMVTQIERLKGQRSYSGSPYVHMQDVEWLREAIDEKLSRGKEITAPVAMRA